MHQKQEKGSPKQLLAVGSFAGTAAVGTENKTMNGEDRATILDSKCQ